MFAQVADNDPFWYRILERFFRLIIETFEGIQITTIIALTMCVVAIFIFLSPFGFIPNWKLDKKVALVVGTMVMAIGFSLFFNPLITEAEIIKPQNNEKFSQSQLEEIPIEVRVLDKEKSKYLWLVDHSNLWFPQYNLDNLDYCQKLNNIFTCRFWIKGEIGTHTLHILATDKQVNQQFQDHVDESKRSQAWKGIALPRNGVTSEAEVTIEVIK